MSSGGQLNKFDVCILYMAKILMLEPRRYRGRVVFALRQLQCYLRRVRSDRSGTMKSAEKWVKEKLNNAFLPYLPNFWHI